MVWQSFCGPAITATNSLNADVRYSVTARFMWAYRLTRVDCQQWLVKNKQGSAATTMANIFISHSSHDKPFVMRFAAGLLSKGLPIWLDSWRMVPSDSLLDMIYNGLSESSFVILILSEKSIKSEWVNREINASLSKEEQEGRKFLIPIRIDDCVAPLKIADRIYADFRPGTNFYHELSKISGLLIERGCREVPVLPEREIVCVRFSREVDIDVLGIKECVSHIRRRNKNIVLQENQISFDNDHEYNYLVSELYAEFERLNSEYRANKEVELYINRTIEAFESHSSLMRKVLAFMINKNCSNDSIYWFAKMIRARVVYALWSAQRVDPTKNISYGKTWEAANYSSNVDATKFFEFSSGFIAKIRDIVKSEWTFSIWADEAGLRDEYKDNVFGFFGYRECFGNSNLDNKIIAQMVMQYFRFQDECPEPTLNLDGAIFSRS